MTNLAPIGPGVWIQKHPKMQKLVTFEDYVWLYMLITIKMGVEVYTMGSHAKFSPGWGGKVVRKAPT